MEYSQILYETKGPIALITLNRPEKLNAWTPTMCEEQAQAIERANKDKSVGAIIMTGAGRGFCAGADVQDARRGAADRDRLRRVRDWRFECRRAGHRDAQGRGLDGAGDADSDAPVPDGSGHATADCRRCPPRHRHVRLRTAHAGGATWLRLYLNWRGPGKGRTVQGRPLAAGGGMPLLYLHKFHESLYPPSAERPGNSWNAPGDDSQPRLLHALDATDP